MPVTDAQVAVHKQKLTANLASVLAFVTLAACTAPDAPAPPFARVPYEPLSRQAAVAIAFDEGRLWDSQVDNDPFNYAPADLETMPERQDGVWQRVGEYWWKGMNAGERDARYTGRHNASGHDFPAKINGEYSWSAAFISYVMRLAGAGRAFPYALDHARYINSAARGQTRLPTAEDPATYPPLVGDLICIARSSAWRLLQRLADERFFASHCGIVTGRSPGEVDMVGGNVDDAVVMTKVAALPHGRLSDGVFKWLVVLRVNYGRWEKPNHAIQSEVQRR
jgi:Uncharacterized protein conserved in bacteria (DUF2272)